MRNSNGEPSQLGLPPQPMGIDARDPDWAASLFTRKGRKCEANLMDDNRIDD